MHGIIDELVIESLNGGKKKVCLTVSNVDSIIWNFGLKTVRMTN